MRRPPIATLFPYTTLFRSLPVGAPDRPVQVVLVVREALEVLEGPPVLHVHRQAVGLEAEHPAVGVLRSEEHTSELQSHVNLVCRLLLEKKNPSVSNDLHGQ